MVLTRIVLMVALAQVFIALIPPPAAPSLRISIALLLALLGLIGVAVTFRDVSLSWQLALQSIAFAGVAVGVGLLIRLLFDDWRRLKTVTGVAGVGILLAGIGAAAYMRYIQAKPRRKHRPSNKSLERTREE